MRITIFEEGDRLNLIFKIGHPIAIIYLFKF